MAKVPNTRRSSQPAPGATQIIEIVPTPAIRPE
jgi:hypothetical protein